jgi:hypothetical protein
MATYNINHSGDAIYNLDNKQNIHADLQRCEKEARSEAHKLKEAVRERQQLGRIS